MYKNINKTNWDCTDVCKSTQHSQLIISAITNRSLTDRQIATYLFETCCNFAKIQDNYGRTALHIAASCGRLDLCLWLSLIGGADINVKDWESGYTALQRSIYYGNVNVAVRLIEMGADINLVDKEDFSPLNLVTLDKLPEFKIESFDASQVYVWGSNLNFTLGIGTDDSRKYPELLVYFKRNGISIKQVSTDEFHTVFVSSNGQVWVCGHGQGGRLGILKEKSLLIPTQLSLPNEECIMAATALNHTVLLMANGTVLSFGSNNHHQLGIIPYVDTCLNPKQVHISNSKSMGPIIGIGAGKYHSIFYNEHTIMVCGMNAGQLGNKKENHCITAPQSLFGRDKPVTTIKTVATSSGSIVYSLNNGDVFIMHQFQFKKIASRLLGIVKLAAYGGYLSSNIVPENGEELKVLILTQQGTVILWTEKTPHLLKCSYGLRRSLVVHDFHINENCLLFLTVDGEAFLGFIKEKEVISKSHENNKRRSLGFIYKNEKRTECNDELGKCMISLKRIPFIHRGLSITSDSKGKNFIIIQADSNNSYELLINRTDEVDESLKLLLREATEDDTVHDIVFNIKGTKMAAHRYILAMNDFPKPVLYSKNKNKMVEIYINDVHPVIFEEFLLYIYTKNCNLLETGFCNARFLSLDEDPLKLLSDLAHRYQIVTLINKLESLRFENGQIFPIDLTDLSKSCKLQRNSYPEFYDIEIKADNGQFKAHKCILVARLQYFNSMFLRGWSEAKNAESITLQTSLLIAEAFIDFLYSNEIPDYINCEEIDNVVRLFTLSDQFILTQLKESCELLLAKSINLKNCVNILQLANIYNTVKLKEPVMQFITSNLSALLESRILEVLDNQTLLEITGHYKRNTRHCSERILTSLNDIPSPDEIINISKSLITSSDTFFQLPSNIKEAYFNKCNESTPNCKKKGLKKSSPHNVELIEENSVAENGNLDQSLSETPVKDCAKLNTVNDNVKDKLFNKTEFPSLLENYVINKSGSFRFRVKLESRTSRQPQGQKQRKKALSESDEQQEPTSSPPQKTQFKGWAVIPPPIVTSSIITSPEYNKNIEPNLFEIITSEQTEKENLKKMKSKSFLLTQLEDAAIEDLLIFYNADNTFDERITVQRVLPSNIALPVWIPGKKKKAYEEF